MADNSHFLTLRKWVSRQVFTHLLLESLASHPDFVFIFVGIWESKQNGHCSLNELSMSALWSKLTKNERLLLGVPQTENAPELWLSVVQKPSEIEVQAFTGGTAWLVTIYKLVNIHWQIVSGMSELVALRDNLEVNFCLVWVVSEHTNCCLNSSSHWGDPDSSDVQFIQLGPVSDGLVPTDV